MTPEQLAEIEQRVNAATPGPWTPSERYPHIAWQGKEIDEDCEFIISTTLSERPAEDIRFVAHAREDVPALLAEVKRLTALRDVLRDGLGAILIRAQVFEANPDRADELLKTISTVVADLQRIEAEVSR